jgi:hypothetical protein
VATTTTELFKKNGYEQSIWQPGRHLQGVFLAAGLTVFVILIHGYHPYAEDGGVYLSGIKHLLNPGLYPAWGDFVTAHLHFSLFAPAVAALVGVLHLDLMTVIFMLYAACIWMTLFAAWQIAVRIFPSVFACCGAVVLLALWLTLPIAGTSLMLMDPYVSARSISTPCGLLALAGAIDICGALNRLPWRGWALCLGSLAIAALVHPLMAAYACGCVILLACASIPDRGIRRRVTLGLCFAAIVLAALLNRFAPSQMADYAQVVQTRTYWFLDQWRWYELCGLIAPLLILGFSSRWTARFAASSARPLATMCVSAGLTSCAVALLLARSSASSYLVASLQPLRIFQTIYIVMILVLGAAMGRWLLKANPSRWAAAIIFFGSVMTWVQIDTFPHSAHLEFPWVAPSNQWEQAFLWIRSHTPEDAVFAMDDMYITSAGEDSQNFRAIAERSALPDYSKDGGIASIAPRLSTEWMRGEAAQKDLDDATDAQRMAKLRVSSVDWVVLPKGTPTAFDCAYANTAAKVCRLPGPGPQDEPGMAAARALLAMSGDELSRQSTVVHLQIAPAQTTEAANGVAQSYRRFSAALLALCKSRISHS